MSTSKKMQARKRRHLHIRKKIIGSSNIPRLSVYKSNKNIYAQIIDDEKGVTMVSSSSKQLKINNGGNKDAAKLVGQDIAKKAKENNIKKLVFDRGGFLYHGRIKELADSIRNEGLEI